MDSGLHIKNTPEQHTAAARPSFSSIIFAWMEMTGQENPFYEHFDRILEICSTAAFQCMNMPFEMLNSILIGSQYWNVAFGRDPGEVTQDTEGMQTMRNLARNLLWMIQCIQVGKAAGIQPPQAERSARTNFIR